MPVFLLAIVVVGATLMGVKLAQKAAQLPTGNRESLWLHRHPRWGLGFVNLILLCMLSGLTRDLLGDASKPDHSIFGFPAHGVAPSWLLATVSSLASGCGLVALAALAFWHVTGMFSRHVTPQGRRLHRSLVALVTVSGLLMLAIALWTIS